MNFLKTNLNIFFKIIICEETNINFIFCIEFVKYKLQMGIKQNDHTKFKK